MIPLHTKLHEGVLGGGIPTFEIMVQDFKNITTCLQSDGFTNGIHLAANIVAALSLWMNVSICATWIPINRPKRTGQSCESAMLENTPGFVGYFTRH